MQMFIGLFSGDGIMAELVQYLDNMGHKLGIGGFEGVIGAVVLLTAAIVIVVHAFSLLRRGTSNPQIDGHLRNPLEWMENAEKTIGCDRESQACDPGWDMLPHNVWHKKEE